MNSICGYWNIILWFKVEWCLVAIAETTQVSVDLEQNYVPTEESVPNGTEAVVVPKETEVVVAPNETEVILENGVDSAAAEIEVVVSSAAEQIPKDVAPAVVIPSSVPRGDSPKMSYASIVSLFNMWWNLVTAIQNALYVVF